MEVILSAILDTFVAKIVKLTLYNFPNIRKMLKITECPRDAMQGIHDFIPTELKAKYINLLLNVGFDTIDFGSFVSPKAIPQLQDTAAVLSKLDLGTPTKLLAIIANYRGAEDAAAHEEISFLGFPFSVSETFQKRNTNKTIAEAFEDVKKIQALCSQKKKNLLVYISMGFGNPYNDPWSADIVNEWVGKLYAEGIRYFNLSDTVGVAKATDITGLFTNLIPAYPDIEFGAHLHSRPDRQDEKIGAAYDAGCRKFDAAMHGFGGCPMAEDELVGNVSTEGLIFYLKMKGEQLTIHKEYFKEAADLARQIFGDYM